MNKIHAVVELVGEGSVINGASTSNKQTRAKPGAALQSLIH